MQKIIKIQRITFITSLIVLLGCVGGMFWLGQYLKSKIAQVTSTKDNAASYEINKKAFSKEAEILSEFAARTTALEAYRAPLTATPDLLSGLEALATKKNIDFSITNVQALSGAASALTIEFQARGSSSAMDSFLEALLHQAYEVTFTDFALSREVSTEQVSTSAPKPGATPSAPTLPMWRLVGTIQIKS